MPPAHASGTELRRIEKDIRNIIEEQVAAGRLGAPIPGTFKTENFALEGKAEFRSVNPSVKIFGGALRCWIG